MKVITMNGRHRRALMLFIVPFLGLMFLEWILNQWDLTLAFTLGDTDPIQYWVMGGLTLFFVVPSVIVTALKVHDREVKRKKQVPLTYYFWILFLTSLLTAYSFVLFRLQYYYILLVVLFLILLYLSSFLIADRRYVFLSQKGKIDVNDELIMKLLVYLGGKENVMNVTFEHRRLKVELQDPKIVNLEGIQELGATGIFVAGNRLQAFVGQDAERLQQAIENYLSQTT